MIVRRKATAKALRKKTFKKVESKGDRAVVQVGVDHVEVPLKPKHFKNSGKDGFHGFKMVALNGKVYRCQVMLFEQ